MKKALYFFKHLCLFACLLATVVSVCSCNVDSTMLMTEDARSEYLFSESDKYYDPLKYHIGFDVTVKHFNGDQSNKYNVVFDEYYDATDESNVKYLRREIKNDFAGFADTCTYVDGTMYLSSENRKLRVKVSDKDEMFSYLDHYSVYCDAQFPVTFTCPPMKDGKYTYSQEATAPRKLISLYENIYWAIPPHLYDKLKISSYKDTYVFDSKGRILTFEARIEARDPNNSIKESVLIIFKQTYYYDDFEISAPENARDYHLLNNYYAALDAIASINQYLNEQRGSFEFSFDLKLRDGSNEHVCREQSHLNYTTEASGLLTFDMVSVFTDAAGIDNTAYTTYDGALLISESEGSRRESPVSQEEAIYTLNGYKDFLWINDGTFGTVTKYSDYSGDHRSIEFSFAEKYISELLTNELSYYYGITPDEGSMNAMGDCKIRVLNIGNIEVADEILVTGSASFKIGGNPVSLTYNYTLTVIDHE